MNTKMEGHITETLGLFTRNVPHILAKIIFYLDYESYKRCHEVNRAWHELLTSDSYQKRAKVVFHEGIWKDENNLWSAAEAGNVAKVKRFLSHLVDVNCARGERDDTPLIQAAKCGHEVVIKMLLDKGANPNKRNKYGLFPLQAAFYDVSLFQEVSLKFKEVKDVIISSIKVLLEGGADPNQHTAPEGDPGLI